MPDTPKNDPVFLKKYAELLAAHDGSKPHPAVRHRTGTLGAGIRAYLASDVFMSLAPTTRALWRRALEDIEARYGAALFDDLQTRHIRKDLSRLNAHPANTRRKIWRGLCRWAEDAGLIEEDPARAVRRRATPKTDGRVAWTRDDVAKFRAHWPHDTHQRLAFELMHRTCAAIGDAGRLGPGMIKDGWLTYRRQKSGSEATCPFNVPGPAWFEADDHLRRCLDQHPRHMTFLVTGRGAPRSPKAAAQWFSRACTAAGLDADKTAHGIRKHRAAVFKENGATDAQRMAILGHETASEAARYSKSADLRRIISGTESSHSDSQSSQKS
ncbi:hypothetical protein BOO69_08150 [Sulfitobacter alexandrii]|uniref:Tyr recombinase domain-containing protein n=2 Tax=Sulfitobacter alexandrii TaxID=1917485 RepID=A0A1J0WGD1_9RHOB|nr:hypothetical protein BOO69_08150 [Sulfitobacter alexandrii]